MTKLPVYLRLKPRGISTDNESFLRLAAEKPGEMPDTHQVIVDPPKDSRYKAEEVFDFNGVFREACGQQDIYRGAVSHLVEHVALGRGDGLFFSMGASGSGKTHTVLGHRNAPGMIHFAVDTFYRSFEDKMADFEDIESVSDKCNPDRTSSAIEAGIMMNWTRTSIANPASVSTQNHKILDINNLTNNDKPLELGDDYKYAIYISMVEIYNDRVFDLLDETTSAVGVANGGHRRPLPMKADPKNGKIFLSNVRKVFTSDRIEAFKTIDEGMSHRAMHSTGSNLTSSRSHAFVNVEIKRIHRDPRKRNGVHSTTLSIVDLAGSERVKVSKTNGNRLVESCAINKSLMLLGQCLQKQRDREENGDGAKAETSIFRNSRLTQLLLSNAFNNDLSQKSVLLVNVDPYGEFSATSQILRYSALARQVSVPKTRITSLSSIAAAVAARNVSSSSVSSSLSSARTVSSSSSVTSVSTASSSRSASRTLPTSGITVDLKAKLEAMEQLVDDLQLQLSETNERCFMIEEQVRQEMADQIDIQTQQMHDRYRLMMAHENERGQEFTDKKLELLADVVKRAEYDRLIEENETLKMENVTLRQENEMLQSSLCTLESDDQTTN